MITRQELDQVLLTAGKVKALVIGDVMLDQYIYGQVDRISPEAPVPVLSHQRTDVKAGGAANVALNLAAWGCTTSLIGMTGQDAYAETLSGLLESEGIRHRFYFCPDRPTTVKTRVVASSHHLLRIDHESSVYLNHQAETEALELITSAIEAEKPDLIIIEDYNKGFLTLSILQAIIREGKKYGAFIAVDPKETHFFDYQGVDLFKPNLREASHAAHQPLHTDNLGAWCSSWREKMTVATIAITLGSQGIFLQNQFESAHIRPERAIDVVDVCGAGDAVICALALGLLSGLPVQACGSLANATGGYVCSHSGVVTPDVKLLFHWI